MHRPHTLIGYALGNVMNMGVTLAVYGALCRATGDPFVFPGSPQQLNGVTDLTDARLLGRHVLWSSTEPRARNQAFNTVNGEVFRWRQLWPQVAEALGVPAGEYPGHPQPLEGRMDHADEVWAGLVEKHDLAPYKASELASWWHTDADLGREVETFADMSKSRSMGFLDYQSTIGVLHRPLPAAARRPHHPRPGLTRCCCPSGLGHLTYSTLVHPGDTWPEMWESLRTFVPAVKARVSPDAPFGVSLRLSGSSAATLAGSADLRAELRDFLRDGGALRLHRQCLPARAVQGPHRDGGRLRARLVDASAPRLHHPGRRRAGRHRRRRACGRRSRRHRWPTGPTWSTRTTSSRSSST